MSVFRLNFVARARVLMLIASTLLTSEFAMAQAAPGGPAPSPLLQMVPLIVVVGIMYFLVLRPQMRKQKQHQEFTTTLKRGDEILTTGGILGRIEGLTEMYATVEIAPNVRIRVIRSQIASHVPTVTSGVEVKA